ncbi:MAG TPA: methyltransferase domain-containing protein [Acidimicrobiia bacterium]|nr:methyltransferase domain-containing protein [Acidimicrobiia bacterium]
MRTRMFGIPTGVLGRIGGLMLARFLGPFNEWVIELLEVTSSDRILEVGYGPGVATELLAAAACDGFVAGVDPSTAMFHKASARNAAAIQAGRVDLRLGVAEALPFDDATFDLAMSVNSMQIWPNPGAGLHEIKRCLRVGGRVACAFTPVTGQSPGHVTQMVEEAGFAGVQIAHSSSWLRAERLFFDSKDGFCALAVKEA